MIDLADEAFIEMKIQELGAAMQFELPVNLFIVNNCRMVMVRQWQELHHGARYLQSYF